ncbi:hypothetical protein B9Z33_04845 [Limnohabitans sp. T6-20]|nr:hypothetical protein B9Z33_04845 [Limnohabitans sp. T6-20]
MSAVPTRPTPTETQPGSGRPSRRTLGWLVGRVLVLHVALLLSLTGTLDWRLPTTESMRVAPMRTRWVPPAPAPRTTTQAPTPAKPRTRVATEPQQAIAPPAAKATPASADVAAASTSLPADEGVLVPGTHPAPAASEASPSQASASNSAPTRAPDARDPAVAAAPPPATANESLPPIPLGALPPPVLLSYRLTGQEKGLTYYANGELRWQHNAAAYALSLSVKAFLVGSRHWRSQGEITGAGLAPTRFSDSWRNERAAHFDRANNRVVFSNNAPVAALEPGAQDQISLYVQLAAAMAGDPQRFQPGTRLQVQTATLKDALPWLLTLEPPETLTLDGQALPTVKWVCQPRNRFDAKVEFWVSPRHAWMPVRIRITQVSGSFIDLLLRGQEALPPLPTVAAAG